MMHGLRAMSNDMMAMVSRYHTVQYSNIQYLLFLFSFFALRGDILSISSPVRTVTNATGMEGGGILSKIHNCHDVTSPLSGELKYSSYILIIFKSSI
jgi:hypothetical protein